MDHNESILRQSWERLLAQYVSGKVILLNEKDLEVVLQEILQELTKEQGVKLEVVRQETRRGKIIDLRIGEIHSCILLQLKLYRDKVDWKEIPSMTNTVESDLNFAKGSDDIYVAVIDTIPSTTRLQLPFHLNWQTIEIDEQVFDREYSRIHPKTSQPRERQQKVLLVKGSEIL